MTHLIESIIQQKNVYPGLIYMSDHKHGEMDIKTQTDTFNGFMNFVTKSVIIILVLVVLMAIFIT